MNEPASPGPSTEPLVLIAEDEPRASMALRAQLEALDYRVLGPARDGDEALALGACFPIDIALFDVRMPGRSGLQAALELFEMAPTPVVLLTGVGTADLPDPIPAPPIFQVLTKPVGLPELAAGLRTARARFLEWRASDTRTDHGDPDPRAAIARAVEILAGDRRPADAAARLLQRAREEQRSPDDVARDILAGTP
jgi:CheY-like chemotaxis protein